MEKLPLALFPNACEDVGKVVKLDKDFPQSVAERKDWYIWHAACVARLEDKVRCSLVGYCFGSQSSRRTVHAPEKQPVLAPLLALIELTCNASCVTKQLSFCSGF